MQHPNEVMEKLKKWAKEKKLLEFAIPQDNPETTLPYHCRFDACIVIPNDYQVDNLVFEGELSGGKYLIYEVKHIAEIFKKHILISFNHYRRMDIKWIKNQLWD